MGKKRTVICIAAAAAIMLIVSYFAGMRNADDPNGKTTSSEQSAGSVSADKDIRPLYVEADTDDARHYGTDILFARDGLMIKLISSRFEGSGYSSTVRIECINDTDQEALFETDYVIVNGIATSCSTLAIVPPHETVERVLTGLQDYLPDETDPVDDIQIKFAFEISETEEEFTSDRVKIVYNNNEHEYVPKDGSQLIWENADITVYNTSQQYIPDDEETDYDDSEVRLWLYIDNKTDKDLDVYITDDSAYFADGSYADVLEYLYRLSPAHTISTAYIRLSRYYDDLETELTDIKSTTFRLRFVDDDYEAIETDDITIDVDVQPVSDDS